MTSSNPAPSPPDSKGLGRAARLVRMLSLVNLAVMALAVGMLWAVSESAWWGTVFTFLPRLPFLFAPGVLLLCSLLVHRRSVAVNAFALALVLIPLMGLRLNVGGLWAGDSEPPHLRIVSCNVQYYHPDFESVLREITALGPDVVALQEAPFDNELLGQYFPGWQMVHVSEFWVLSRFPMKQLDVCRSAFIEHSSAVTVQIDSPQGPLVLHNLHLTTPRYGLLSLSWSSVCDGSGPDALERWTQLRRDEAREARDYIDKQGSGLPVVIVGDFNTPVCSRLYRSTWEGFTNAFDAAGLGFGYTAPCTTHRHWINDLPWVRIDHILTDAHWSVGRCGIGRGKGSDHRLIWADLSLR
jgi:vancomycin resistance protein VanJ